MASRIESGSPYEVRYGFSRAVRAGDRVLVAGTAPMPAAGEQPAEAPYEQMLRCGEIIITALAAAGAGVEDVVRTRMYITDPGHADAIGRAHEEIFGAARPAATMVVVASLLEPWWLVEAEAEAVVGGLNAP